MAWVTNEEKVLESLESEDEDLGVLGELVEKRLGWIVKLPKFLEFERRSVLAAELANSMGLRE